MSVSVKRAVHVQVAMDESFRKTYIAVLNQFIGSLNDKLSSYESAQRSRKGDSSFGPYIAEKINDTVLKIEQFKFQIERVKRTKVGEPFFVSTLDGYVETAVGDDVMSVLGPAIIESDGQRISRIIA